jgi:hypothetical protein
VESIRSTFQIGKYDPMDATAQMAEVIRPQREGWLGERTPDIP